MADSTYYVRGDSKSLFEGMTKEEILTAIVQAIQSGTIGDVDTGFITRLKEINKGQAFRIWLGTSAEYNALVEAGETEINVLYIKTDDTSAANVSNALASAAERLTALETEVGELDTFTDTMYKTLERINNRVTLLESLKWIPVNGAAWTTSDIATADAMATACGYGTWALLGTSEIMGADDAGWITLNIWRRTE